MSRSIRGYSSANLTIESLSLLGIDATTIGATTGNIITLNSTTVNATNANITNISITDLTIDDATINQLLTANNITASGTITANGNVVVTSLPQDNTDNNDRFIIFQGLNNILRSDSKLTFNPSTNTLSIIVLTCQDITASGTTTTTNLNIGQLLTTNNNIFYACMFQGDNNDISQAPLLANFHYNPSQLKLKLDNLEVTGGLTVTAQTRSNSQAYPILFQDTSTNEICIESSSTDFTYNPSGNVLDARNINVVVDLTTEKVTLDTGNIFNHSTNVYMALKAISNNGTDLSGFGYNIALWQDGHIRMIGRNNIRNYIYNATSGTTTERLTISDSNVQVRTNLQVDNDATIIGDTTITAVNSTVSNNNRIPFIEGGGGTGRLCESNLYYNPNNETLVSANITTTNAINSPTVTVTGTNNGTLTIDQVFGIFFNHSNGFVFRMAGVWKYRISSSEIGMYANLRLNPDNSNNETDIIFDEYSASASGEKSIIQFSNIGKIKSRRDASLNPVLDFINTGATPEVQYQIQLNSTNNKYNTPDGGSHDFSIDTFSEFEITTSETIVKNTLRLQDVTLPTADANFHLLLQNGGTNQVKRSNLLFNPVSEILTINKLKLEAVDVATATDNKLLFLDPNDEVEKSDSNLSYNATTSTLNFKILDNVSADSKITVQKPLHYGAGQFSQPLNYTLRVGHTDSINTIDVLGSGANTGKFGNGIYLSILRSGVKTTAYGQNSLLWYWNAYVDATNTATNFTMGGLSGLWDINVSFKFQWDSGNTNRANPIIKAEINGTTTQEEGVDSQYVRQQLGRVVTVKYHNKLYFNTSDTIAFRTFLNIGSITNFSSLATSSQFDLSDFMFMATYMGPLDEYDKTPT